MTWSLMLTAIHSPQFTVLYGAGDGIRTRDPNLGKVVLYQLSYTRSVFYSYRLL